MPETVGHAWEGFGRYRIVEEDGVLRAEYHCAGWQTVDASPPGILEEILRLAGWKRETLAIIREELEIAEGSTAQGWDGFRAVLDRVLPKGEEG